MTLYRKIKKCKSLLCNKRYKNVLKVTLKSKNWVFMTDVNKTKN